MKILRADWDQIIRINASIAWLLSLILERKKRLLNKRCKNPQLKSLNKEDFICKYLHKHYYIKGNFNNPGKMQ